MDHRWISSWCYSAGWTFGSSHSQNLLDGLGMLHRTAAVNAIDNNIVAT